MQKQFVRTSVRCYVFYKQLKMSFLRPSDINEGWLISTLDKIPNSKGIKLSLFNF